MDIECDGFDELGIPTPLECWKHQAHMLACEVGDLKKDLSNARRNVHQLVIMHTNAAKERDVLALEVHRLRWELSDKLREDGMAAGRRLVPGPNVHQGYGKK
jgi:hypothetical protein